MTELKSLRLKFVLYHMLIVTAVIGAAAMAGVTILRQRILAESSEILAHAAAGELSAQIFAVTPYVRIPYFALTIGSDGEIVLMDGSYNSFPEEDFLEEVASLGISSLSEEGVLPDYHLRYLRLSTAGGYILAFTDTSYEDSVRANLTRNFLLIGAAMWVGLFVMSWFFARWAVRPVGESIQKQKQFVADASHELKTPLTVIHANAELIRGRMGGASPDVDKWLNNLNQECRGMRHLIEELLLLARSEREVDAVRRESFDLSELVTESALEWEPVFFQSGRRLDAQIEENVVIHGDREQIGSLIRILLDNAVKYSDPAGQTTLALWTVSRRRVLLSVTTPGRPLSERERKDVFRRFYRSETARRTNEGCGLGLAIATRIAHAHHARIEAEVCAEPGREANVFRVLLRCKPGNHELHEKQA